MLKLMPFSYLDATDTSTCWSAHGVLELGGALH